MFNDVGLLTNGKDRGIVKEFDLLNVRKIKKVGIPRHGRAILYKWVFN
jgi:hypothetical protein